MHGGLADWPLPLGLAGWIFLVVIGYVFSDPIKFVIGTRYTGPTDTPFYKSRWPHLKIALSALVASLGRI